MAVTTNYRVRRIEVTYPPYNKATGGHNPNAVPATTTIIFEPADAQVRNTDRIYLVLSGDQRANYAEGQTTAVGFPNSA